MPKKFEDNLKQLQYEKAKLEQQLYSKKDEISDGVDDVKKSLNPVNRVGKLVKNIVSGDKKEEESVHLLPDGSTDLSQADANTISHAGFPDRVVKEAEFNDRLKEQARSRDEMEPHEDYAENFAELGAILLERVGNATERAKNKVVRLINKDKKTKVDTDYSIQQRVPDYVKPVVATTPPPVQPNTKDKYVIGEDD